MNRVYNFSAGPSMLPLEVLEKAASELVCYGESGMSVMEMSHRSPDYEAIINDAEAMLRKLMNIPDNYKVLFLQGGASTQFAAVPLNLIGRTGKADYVVSGQFSGKAYKEAQKMGYDVKCIATTKEDNFDHVPVVTKDMIREDAAYLHICFNNTIYGTKYPYIPETGDIPLVADMYVRRIGSYHILRNRGNMIEIIFFSCSYALNVIAELLRFLERLARELTGYDVVCLARSLDKVKRNCRKLCGRAALKEKHLVIFGNVHQLAKHSLSVLDDRFIVRRSMGHLHNRHS